MYITIKNLLEKVPKLEEIGKLSKVHLDEVNAEEEKKITLNDVREKPKKPDLDVDENDKINPIKPYK